MELLQMLNLSLSRLYAEVEMNLEIQREIIEGLKRCYKPMEQDLEGMRAMQDKLRERRGK